MQCCYAKWLISHGTLLDHTYRDKPLPMLFISWPLLIVNKRLPRDGICLLSPYSPCDTMHRELYNHGSEGPRTVERGEREAARARLYCVRAVENVYLYKPTEGIWDWQIERAAAVPMVVQLEGVYAVLCPKNTTPSWMLVPCQIICELQTFLLIPPNFSVCMCVGLLRLP